MFMKYFFMFIDSVFGFIALFILTKVLGKTHMSQLTPFDFISAVVLGELVGTALFDKNSGITEIAFLVLVWGGMLFLVEIITQKYRRARPLLEGQPSILIHNGNIIFEELKRNRVDIDQLQHMLRNKDVFSMKEVAFAILETNGQLSVLKSAPYQTPNKKDMNIYPNPVFLPATIISDGEIVYDTLKEKNLTEEWLLQELKRQKFDSAEDVLYAEYTENQKLYIQPYIEKSKRDQSDDEN